MIALYSTKKSVGSVPNELAYKYSRQSQSSTGTLTDVELDEWVRRYLLSIARIHCLIIDAIKRVPLLVLIYEGIVNGCFRCGAVVNMSRLCV